MSKYTMLRTLATAQKSSDYSCTFDIHSSGMNEAGIMLIVASYNIIRENNIMRVEFDKSCERCDNRPVCELAGIQGRNLENSARKLGFTVTEGSVACLGLKYEAILEGLVCKARVAPPELASRGEHEKIAALAKLEIQADALLESTRELVKQLKDN